MSICVEAQTMHNATAELVLMEEFSGCDVCGENHDTDECPIIAAGQRVSDSEAPSRARLTLPANLQVRNLIDGTTAVITKEPIAAASQFGPFEAKRSTEFNLATRFPLKIFDKDGSFLFLDCTDESECSWMCLVAMATTEEEMNLIAYQVKQDIYFSTNKPIRKGEELRVWYSPAYAKKMNSVAPWEAAGKQAANVRPLVVWSEERPRGFRLSQTIGLKPERRGRRRKRKRFRHRFRGYSDDEEYDEETQSTRKEIIQTLDPRRLGFKELKEWKCSQCGAVYENCLDFAYHLSDHYKPRPVGARRSDAGRRRPKNYPCDICGRRFTTERMRHKHRMCHHHRVLRRVRSCKVILEDLKYSRNKFIQEKMREAEERADSYMENSEEELEPTKDEDEFKLKEAETLLQISSMQENLTECNNNIVPVVENIETTSTPSSTNILPVVEAMDTNEEAMKDESKEEQLPCTIVSTTSLSETEPQINLPEAPSTSELLQAAIQQTLSNNKVVDDQPVSMAQTLEGVIRDIILPDKPIVQNGEEESTIMMEISNNSDGTHHSDQNGDMDLPVTCIMREDLSGNESDDYHIRGLRRGKFGRYSCDICHKRFEKSIYLFRHIRKHTGDFTCLKCHKVFARKESMVKHICNVANAEARECLSCPFCQKTFTSERLLKRHIAKHTGEFTCDDCGKSYSSREILASHICSKVPVTERYACEICHKTFSQLKYLDKHIPVHTGVYSCPICGKWLRSNDSLINHMRICGQVKELEANGTAVCPHCKEEFTDLKAFRRHMYDHTHMFACESCGARFRNKLSLSIHVCNAERSISCDECGKVFNCIANLNQHRLSHGEPQYSCSNCGRSYYRKETLLKHPCERAKRTRGRSDKKPPSLLPLICEVCGSLFSSTSSLNVHRNLHGEKKFACEVCGKRFHRKDLLLEHMAVHGQPEIPCPVCSKLFKTKKSLDVHLLIHDGIKRFKCQTCGKMFYQKGNLQKHEETHVPGRKHTCPHCNKSFGSKEYLTIHILEHTRGRIFACETCGRSFVKEHQLKAHMRIFHGNQAYVCKFCGLSVKLRHSLKRHLEKKHSNTKSEWETNEQIAAMLIRQIDTEEPEEELLDLQGQEAIITEVSPTQGAEVLLAVAGIGSAALQQAIAAGTARIQQGAAPNTIEISLPVGAEDLEHSIMPGLTDENGETQTIIQHVVADQEGNLEAAQAQHIQIAVSSGDGDEAPQIAVVEGETSQEDTLPEGTIVLENGTILQQGHGTGNATDLLLYVLTTTEAQEGQ